MSKKISHQFNCSKMMLPEQSSSLEHHRKELARQLLIPAGEPDPQLQEEHQRMLELAMAKNLLVELVTLENGCSQRSSGRVEGIDQVAGEIILRDGSFPFFRVKADRIIKMGILSEEP